MTDEIKDLKETPEQETGDEAVSMLESLPPSAWPIADDFRVGCPHCGLDFGPVAQVHTEIVYGGQNRLGQVQHMQLDIVQTPLICPRCGRSTRRRPSPIAQASRLS